MDTIATKIRLFIGADNRTKKITKTYEKKVEKILAKYWDNFSLIKHKGYYEGESEESISAIILVLNFLFKDLEDCVEELKVQLIQDTIGIEITADVDFKLK